MWPCGHDAAVVNTIGLLLARPYCASLRRCQSDVETVEVVALNYIHTATKQAYISIRFQFSLVSRFSFSTFFLLRERFIKVLCALES